MSDAASPAERRRDGPQRLLNTVALVLLAAGAALYLFALWRMNRIAAGNDALAGAVANLDRWHALRRLSEVALWVAAAGIATAVGAAIRHSLRTRRLADHGLQDRH